MKKNLVFTALVLLASVNITSTAFASNAAPPPSTLTVTATELAGGGVNFALSGTSFGKVDGSTVNELPSGTRTPQTAGKAKANVSLPNGLVLTNTDSGSSANVSNLIYSPSKWFLGLDTGLSFDSGSPLTGSGSVTTSDVNIAQFGGGGGRNFSTVVSSGLFDIHYAIVSLAPPVINDAPSTSSIPSPAQEAPATLPAPDEPAPPAPILVANIDAIESAETGLGFSGANQGILQNLVGGATGDINNRLFNARSGGGSNGGAGVTSNRASSDTVSKYLAFTDSQNIDPMVALGLREGRTIEVVDTLAMQDAIPVGGQFSMLGGFSLSSVPLVTKAVVAMPAGTTDGKNPVDTGVIYNAQPTKWEVFSTADYGFYDQDRLTQSVAGFEVDSYSGTLGVEYDAADWLSVGLAWTHAWSNAEVEGNLGGIDLEGDLATVYATAFRGNTWLDLFYSYGEFENETSRDTLIGRQALGDTESQTHNAGATLGHNYHLKQGLIAGATLGLNYAEGGVDAYTERNGGLANLHYGETEFDSLVGRLGTSLTCIKEVGVLGTLTSQLRAGWAHEFSPSSDSYSATLVNSPFALLQGNSSTSVGGYTASAQSAHPGTDWLELGVGTRLDLGESWNFSLNYEGQFGRNNATAHYGQARVGYEW